MQNICRLLCLPKNGWIYSSGGENEQESEAAVKIHFAVYHGVNHFVEWNPKLNSDEMNVLINWQSRADVRLIERFPLSTNSFHCLEPSADFHLWRTMPHAVEVVDD